MIGKPPRQWEVTGVRRMLRGEPYPSPRYGGARLMEERVGR